MRIENSNLALQGSSFSATVVKTSLTQEVIARKMVDLSATNNPERSITRIRGDDYEGSGNPIPEGEKTKVNDVIVSKQPQVVHKSNALGGYSALMSRERIRMMILEQLLGRLTGQKSNMQDLSSPHATSYNSSGQAVFGMQNPRLANTVRETYTVETVKESGFSFAAKGTVQTGDGKTLNLELNFSFSQSFSASTTIVSEVQQRLVDPLVINFTGEMPEFTDNTISFDLDCDGAPDDISMLKPGSGFLALDKDGNGKIDDGSELFGPASGDGFSELAKYDEDGNGWIDEDDSVFGKLKIWSTDSQGENHLVAIKDKNVGAIYLGFAKTEMNVRSSEQSVGKLQKSGLVLLEGGESRMMQEIDLRI